MRRLAAILVVALLGGCAVRYTHPNGTTVCGVKLPTGAESIGGTPLESPGVVAGPAPAADELPAPLDPIDARYNSATWVRVSDSCDHGAIVTVRPVLNARLLTAIRAKDHHVVLLIMEVTGPVTVWAWRSGVFAGSLRVTATNRPAG
jgi:hypothetical protein